MNFMEGSENFAVRRRFQHENAFGHPESWNKLALCLAMHAKKVIIICMQEILDQLKGLEAPIGTAAYIKQFVPFPKDGKHGWWSGGFGYGLWIGILVASGFSVVPVSSLSWKREFELTGAGSTKDDSRRVASTLFPSLSDMLKKKKDHGRAEALLIAAYGKGLRMKVDPSLVVENSV
ncbi:hypothetical protein HRI_004861900 [Hibiscus trionum]|uniref:Uncharacterized protein n=1 Tax=Hibiscus trionum TaxID=183268 RepID=A0A9W7JF08_HIBTR|nr:hypothetical protein HRI_004861900 [Hibiscus trionum]